MSSRQQAQRPEDCSLEQHGKGQEQPVNQHGIAEKCVNQGEFGFVRVSDQDPHGWGFGNETQRQIMASSMGMSTISSLISRYCACEHQSPVHHAVFYTCVINVLI